MTPATIRVVVVDDQALVRMGLTALFASEPGIDLVGEAADGRAGVDLVRRARPDVVLMDIRMPGLDGLEVTRALADDPATATVRVIVVTTFDRDEYVARALQVGACGFLLKRSGPGLLVEAVRAAVAGEVLISPQVTVRLLSRDRGALVAPQPADADGLSPREIEIARKVAEGLTNAEIAADLVVSMGTVKTHVANIGSKIGVRNRVGIAAWAWAHGIARP